MWVRDKGINEKNFKNVCRLSKYDLSLSIQALVDY